MESAKSKFACANPEKSAKVKEKLSRIQQEEDQLLQFEAHKSNPVPRSMLVSEGVSEGVSE